MYTIRRHLGRGPQKGHFQIRGYVKDYKQGEVVEYVNPETHSVIFKGCRLHNSEKTATRIINGASKEPCAWIIAESYEIIPRVNQAEGEKLTYNPRKAVNWILSEDTNADKIRFETITTIGAELIARK